MHLFLPYLSCWCINDNECRTKKVSWGQVDFFVKTCHMSFIYIFTNGFFSIDLFNTVKGNIVSNECTCASAATTIVQPYLFCQFWFFVCINRMWWEKLFLLSERKTVLFVMQYLPPMKTIVLQMFCNKFMGKWYI